MVAPRRVLWMCAALAGVAPAAAAAAPPPPSPAQLQTNERIARAAVNRAERLEAAMEYRSPVLQRPVAVGAAVTEAAVRADRFRARTAQWRVSRIAARLDGREDPAPPSAGGHVPITASQLRADQRMAQSAIRRATALSKRIPPALSPPLDGIKDPRLTWIQAVATGPRQITITDTSGANQPVVGSLVFLYSGSDYQPLAKGAPVAAAGRWLDGVFFPFVASVEPVPYPASVASG